MAQKILHSFSFIIIVSTTLFSCATILSKSSYPVSINVNPNGANISIVDKKGKEVFKGQSPTTITLKSGGGFFVKAEYLVKISANGYNEMIVPVNYKLNGWYFGNLLVGGVIGMLIVDPATGAMWKLDTPPVNVTLSKPTAMNEPALNILLVDEVSNAVKANMVQIK